MFAFEFRYTLSLLVAQCGPSKSVIGMLGVINCTKGSPFFKGFLMGKWYF